MNYYGFCKYWPPKAPPNWHQLLRLAGSPTDHCITQWLFLILSFFLGKCILSYHGLCTFSKFFFRDHSFRTHCEKRELPGFEYKSARPLFPSFVATDRTSLLCWRARGWPVNFQNLNIQVQALSKYLMENDSSIIINTSHRHHVGMWPIQYHSRPYVQFAYNFTGTNTLQSHHVNHHSIIITS